MDGYTIDIINPFGIVKKMEAFGFYTVRVEGDNLEMIDNAINQLKQQEDTAVCLVLDTIKGQGVSYFENLFSNHSVKFNNEEINQNTDEAIKQNEILARECGWK